MVMLYLYLLKILKILILEILICIDYFLIAKITYA